MTPATKKWAWPWSTRLRLLLVGWRPNRNVWNDLALPKSFTVFPEAQRVLAQFGNLYFGDENDHIRLEPAVGDEITDCIKVLEEKLGKRLYSVGVWEHQDPMYLLVDEDGVVYFLEVDTLLWPLASSFDRAVVYFARRIWNRHEIDDDLRTVGLLGKTWQLEDREQIQGAWYEDRKWPPELCGYGDFMFYLNSSKGGHPIITFSGADFTYESRDRSKSSANKVTGTFFCDPGKSPHQITFVFADRTVIGIYYLCINYLSICVGEDDKIPPAKFGGGPGARPALLVFSRLKKE
jgi:uncharacterized protein (TIGR03067 family)